LEYSLPVPQSGNYSVTLYFVESFFASFGARIFDIYIQEALVQWRYDILWSAGTLKRLATVTHPTSTSPSSSGRIVVRMESVVNGPIIAGISVSFLS